MDDSRSSFNSLLSLNEAATEYRMSTNTQRLSFPLITLNSTIHFITGLIIAFGFHHLATALTANGFGIPVLIRYYGVIFPISDYSPLWSGDAIRLVFISGPGASLALGVMAVSTLNILPHSRWGCKLLAFWVAIHSFNLAFGGVVTGILTGSGFGHFAKWIYLNETARFFIALVSIFILAFIGLTMTRKALTTAPSLHYVHQENRQLFAIAQVFLPWILGSGIMILIKIPQNPVNEMLLFLTPGVIIGVILAHTASYRSQEFEASFAVMDEVQNEDEQEVVPKEQKETPLYFHWIGGVLCIGIILIYRIGFSSGVAF